MGVCRAASDFALEIVQAIDGRDGTLDSTWAEGDSAELAFHYTEE
jgi:hypothetical protein